MVVTVKTKNQNRHLNHIRRGNGNRRNLGQSQNRLENWVLPWLIHKCLHDRPIQN